MIYCISQIVNIQESEKVDNKELEQCVDLPYILNRLLRMKS